MNSVIQKKKTIEDEAQIFISSRNYSNEKNEKVSDRERDLSPATFIKKNEKKDGVTTCRKPIILKGNLPSVFDIDKLKIIKRYFLVKEEMKEEMWEVSMINIRCCLRRKLQVTR